MVFLFVGGRTNNMVLSSPKNTFVTLSSVHILCSPSGLQAMRIESPLYLYHAIDVGRTLLMNSDFIISSTRSILLSRFIL